MNHYPNSRSAAPKARYETPQIDVLRFAEEDVMTASSFEVSTPSDSNQGEWDPQ